MKTKIIPFDLETAKKIQAGEFEGKIMCNNSEAQIIDFNMIFRGKIYVCAKTKGNLGEYGARLFDRDGKNAADDNNMFHKLVLEVPDDETKFKPFDKVICRDYDDDIWEVNWFSHKENDGDYPYHVCGGISYTYCIHYEGNEHLVGTTYKPKEE